MIGTPGNAQHLASTPVSAAGHTFQWLATGSAAFEAMLQHIERAQRSIALEFYIYKPGAVANRFRMALIAASARGVHVQVLLDGFERMWALAAFNPSSLRNFVRTWPWP